MSYTATGKLSKVTVASLLVALGIIYGDIGTSPLYVYKAIVGTREISTELIYGGVSCIFSGRRVTTQALLGIIFVNAT